MLDENLPTFHIKPTSDDPLSSTIYLSQNGSELQPEYLLRRPDPNRPESKNCYAIAICDSYNPEVLYAEVLVQPEWTQPSLSQAEIRAQNGVPQPPVPIVPNTFTIQLYNPEQQVIVRQIASTWNTSAYWEFEMPQNSFRVPSASALDRSQNDPGISAVTPKIGFKWKRDGKLSRDISCFLVGKSTDGKKNREPDITVAMFKEGRSPRLTLYEPNMQRVDVEDAKGLEVVLILGAAVIKDIFFNANREMFNIGSPNTTPNKRKNSGPVIGLGKSGISQPPLSGTAHPLPQAAPLQPSHSLAPNPRAQWEIEAETARLKAEVEAEAKERERRDREEQKRIKKMLEQEEKERRKRDAEVAKETERLKRLYGVPATTPQFQVTPPLPQRPPLNTQPPQSYRPQYQQPISQFHSAPHTRPQPVQRPLSTPSGIPPPQQQASQASLSSWLGASAPGSRWNNASGQNGPYLQAPGNATASSSGFFGLGGKKMQKKRSVYF